MNYHGGQRNLLPSRPTVSISKVPGGLPSSTHGQCLAGFANRKCRRLLLAIQIVSLLSASPRGRPNNPYGSKLTKQTLPARADQNGSFRP